MADNKPVCCEKGCDKPVYALKRCAKHYRKHYKAHGATLARNGEPLAFLMKAVLNPPRSCIIWPFAKSTTGHGRVYFDKKWTTAYRVAWEIYHNRKIPDGMEVAHDPISCTSASCVNPLHLRIATHQENMADMIVAGTSTRGEKNPRSKLSEEQARHIKNSTEPTGVLAEMFGVSRGCICGIRAGRIWGWLV